MLSGVFEVGTPFKFEEKVEICRQTATQLWQQQEISKGILKSKTGNTFFHLLTSLQADMMFVKSFTQAYFTKYENLPQNMHTLQYFWSLNIAFLSIELKSKHLKGRSVPRVSE